MPVDHAVLDRALLAADGYVAIGPLGAIGIFVGIPVLIIAIVVIAVYATNRDGRKPRGPDPVPPLTEPILGSPRAPEDHRPEG